MNPASERMSDKLAACRTFSGQDGQDGNEAGLIYPVHLLRLKLS